MPPGVGGSPLGEPPIPGAAGRALLRATRLVLPLMHPACALEHGVTDGRLAQVLRACTARATPGAAARLYPFRQAVYITYDVWAGCRYVGSVARADGGAAAPRLGEHYSGHRGKTKRETWNRIVVLGLSEALPVDVVRQVEGRVAYALAPLDGSAHPAFVTGVSLADLAPVA